MHLGSFEVFSSSSSLLVDVYTPEELFCIITGVLSKDRKSSGAYWKWKSVMKWNCFSNFWMNDFGKRSRKTVFMIWRSPLFSPSSSTNCVFMTFDAYFSPIWVVEVFKDFIIIRYVYDFSLGSYLFPDSVHMASTKTTFLCYYL